MGKELFESCPGSRAFMTKVREKQKEIRDIPYCMAAIDIEHFRLFNKMYGRAAGDELLLAIYTYLEQLMQEHEGAAGYFGADNFCVYLPKQRELLEQIRDRIISELNRYDTAGFYPMIGVCAENSAPEIMYDRATTALSEGLHNHSDRISWYVQQMESDLEEEFLLLNEIQKGLKQGEFTFYAQPQCNISTGKIVGAEALVRWIKPSGELISPGKFIPVLEKNGMIDQLDRYVWECVCKWMRSLLDRGYEAVPMSINVSRIDIFSMDVPKYLMALIKKYKLPESLIKVEITESAYAESNERITGAVVELRSHGFKVMMDDFGCGYSSLNMLKNIPVDVIKLDMRFLAIDEADTEKGIGILESVVNMARLLHLPIVVEGVETRRQEQFVKGLGCRYSQGYYYYRPLPVEKLEQLLKDKQQLDHCGLVYRPAQPLHPCEFVGSNFFSDSMLNNILGPVAFYEVEGDQVEVTRVNEQYFRLIGAKVSQCTDNGRCIRNQVITEDRQAFRQLLARAFEQPEMGAGGYIHLLRADGSNRLVYMKVFYQKEKDGRRQYYASLTDMDAFPARETEK